jgi:isoquinoline 1-oxidoreductase
MRTAAEAMSGVRVVRDGDFVGIVASDPGQAARAVAALKPRWRAASGQPSNADIFAYLKKNAQAPEPDRGYESGSLEPALASAPVKLSSAYTVAYIAHAPLETRAAVAQWTGGKLDVWTGTQRPFGVRDELAEAVPDPRREDPRARARHGSAYGGKHQGDAPSRPPGWRRRPASPSRSSGRARRSSPGPTSARPASSRSGAERAATA